MLILFFIIGVLETITSDPCKRTTLRALRVRYWSWVPPVAMLVSLPLALVVPMHEPTFGEKQMWGKEAWRFQ